MGNFIWFDPSHFPSKEEYSSVEGWGKAISNAIIERERYELKRDIDSLQEQQFRTFPMAYAMVEMDALPVLRPRTLKAATKLGADVNSDTQAEKNAERLRDCFLELERTDGEMGGWISGDPELAIASSSVCEDDYFLIRGDLPLNPPESIRDANFLSRIEIRQTAETALKSFYHSRGCDSSASEAEIEIVTTTLETRIRKKGWLNLEKSGEQGRIWIEPDDIFERVSVFEENEVVTEEELKDDLTNILSSTSLETHTDSSFDLDPVLSELFERVRGQGWEDINIPQVIGESVEMQTEWYDDNKKLEKRLAKLEDTYHTYFYNPSQEGESKEITERRRETYLFYRSNKQRLSNYDFFDNVDELDGRLRVFEWHLDAAKTWAELAEAEIESGDWEPGENDWKREESVNNPRR